MATCAAQISKQYTQYGAALLFFVFGFKMLYEVITAVGKVNHCVLSVPCMPMTAILHWSFNLWWNVQFAGPGRRACNFSRSPMYIAPARMHNDAV